MILTIIDLFDQAGNVIAVLSGVGAIGWFILRRITQAIQHISSLDEKLDGAIATQKRLGQTIEELNAHQQSINGGIVQHMHDDAVALGELRAAIARLEGRMDGMGGTTLRRTTKP